MTVTYAQFAIGEYAFRSFHEFFFGETPCSGCRGEITPSMIGGKSGRPVYTQRSSQQITVVVIVIQPSEERSHFAFSTIRMNRRAHGGTQVEIVVTEDVCHEITVHTVQTLMVELLKRITDHSV